MVPQSSQARAKSEYPHEKIIELLSQTVSNARLKKNTNNNFNYLDEIDINDVAKESRLAICKNSASIDLDDRCCDSPLIKRRLKFSPKLWNQGPNISPKRAKFNIVGGNIYNNQI